MRLTNVGDGIEDYTYLKLAEDATGDKGWVNAELVKITTDLKHYTSDHAMLQQVRRTLALAIEGGAND